MKPTILIVLILISVHCFGQKWQLKYVDENKDYPYEYWFQFENKDDSCSYQLTTNTNSKNSTVKLNNNQGDTVILASIKVINIANGVETTLTSDMNGKSEFSLENGKYKIEVRVSNYDPFMLEFKIENNLQIDLNIKLGLAPESKVYQINSKTELQESEILDIINCVQLNRKDYHKICSDLNRFYITCHI